MTKPIDKTLQEPPNLAGLMIMGHDTLADDLALEWCDTLEGSEMFAPKAEEKSKSLDSRDIG